VEEDEKGGDAAGAGERGGSERVQKRKEEEEAEGERGERGGRRGGGQRRARAQRQAGDAPPPNKGSQTRLCSLLLQAGRRGVGQAGKGLVAKHTGKHLYFARKGGGSPATFPRSLPNTSRPTGRLSRQVGRASIQTAASVGTLKCAAFTLLPLQSAVGGVGGTAVNG